MAAARLAVVCRHVTPRRLEAAVSGGEILESKTGGVVVVGGMNRDIIAWAQGEISAGSSNIGEVNGTWGGVAHNIALCLSHLRQAPIFLSVIGNDTVGASALRHLEEKGINVLCVRSERSCQYLALLTSGGDLVASVADMASMKSLTPLAINRKLSTSLHFKSSRIVVADGNLSHLSLEALCNLVSMQSKAAVLFEPTSVEKAVRGTALWSRGLIHMISPNQLELKVMAEAIESRSSRHIQVSNVKFSEKVVKSLSANKLPPLSSLAHLKTLLSALPDHHQDLSYHIILTRGKDGVLLVSSVEGRVYISHVPAIEVKTSEIKSASGAGDTLIGAMIWHLLRSSKVTSLRNISTTEMIKALKCGVKAATLTLKSSASVSSEVSPSNILGH
ncbi:hypothetical protein AAMO2058_000207300 [Amorphochlora amoebiformis]